MGKIAVARQLKDYLTHRRSVSLFSSTAPQTPTPPTAKINSLTEWQRNGRASSGIAALVEQLSQTMILNYLRGSSPTYRTVRNQSGVALLNPALSVNDTEQYKSNKRTLAVTANDHIWAFGHWLMGRHCLLSFYRLLFVYQCHKCIKIASW